MAVSSRALPKLSASQLADYLVAPTPTSQMGILRQAKNPGSSKPIIIQYQHARRGISACLQTPELINHLIAQAATNLEQRRDDTANGPLIRDDAQRSIDVLQTFQRSVNALNLWGAEYLPPPNPSPPLMIVGVEVSVWPDAMSLVWKGDEARVGEVFIRCTIGAAGDAAENRRAEANGHLATLAHMHTKQNLGDKGTPYAPASMVIDVPRSVVVTGPVNITRRVRNIEDACRMIAAVWPTL
jgi:hypothetical protein